MQKYRSFCITCRPRQGCTPTTEQAIVTWLKKQDFAIGVIEGKDEGRHLHAQIWLKEPRERGKINTSLQRIHEKTVQDFDQAQLKVLRQGTRIAYSDWHDSYLENNELKNDEVKYCIKNLPEKTLEYYPSEEDQLKLQAKSNAVDSKFHRWEEKWIEYKEDRENYTASWKHVKHFVYDQWFRSRTERVLADSKQRKQFCKTLYMYINKFTIEADVDTEEMLDAM